MPSKRGPSAQSVQIPPSEITGDLAIPIEIDLRTRHLRFDVDLLTNRLVESTRWLTVNSSTRALPSGYFGASTGAAAALIAAAELPESMRAVFRAATGPIWLAGLSLPTVKAPTLLIVGGNDGQVIELNKQAFDQLQCDKELEIVPGATHLFEEPGTLEQVAALASKWLVAQVPYTR
ncbi:MAG: alpha/beta hydrolase [Acidobacteriota bacterium]|nr:alpha/beta hydrolase [Acidobacteriota bacterium]